MKLLLLALASAGLLTVGALTAVARLTPAPGLGDRPAAPSPASAALSESSAAAGSACWVSGDLVGDANPIQVYATLCGAAGSP